MKTIQNTTRWLGLALACAAGTLPAAPLGTAFTFQGQLTDGGQRANGVYELQFTLYDAGSGGSPVAGPLPFSTVTLTNGNFAAELDFGSGVFAGEARWLEIGVRTNGSLEEFTLLSPRQPLTPTPYALYAPSAGAAATADAAALATATEANAVDNVSLQTDSVTTDKILDEAITAAKLDSTIGVWSRSGYDVFRPDGRVGIGTRSPGATLDVRGDIVTGVDGAGGRLLLAAMDDIKEGGEIRLDGAATYDDWFLDVNRNNTRLFTASTNDGRVEISNAGTGEAGLYVEGNVGIGTYNPQAELQVAGTITADNFSGSGAALTALNGSALANSSVTSAKILDGTIANNDLANNSVTSAKIAEGNVWNSDLADNAVTSGKIADGTILNSDLANNSVTSGKIQDGQVSSADIAEGTIQLNDLSPALAASTFWRLGGNAGTMSGTNFLGTTDSHLLELRVNNVTGLRLEYPTAGSVPNLVGGSLGNSVGSRAEGAVIGGGGPNTVGVDSDYSTIGGGYHNTGSGDYATVGGGAYNTNSAQYATVGGGFYNDIMNNAPYATIPGGRGNEVGAGAAYAFAAGRRAKANHPGSFIWADSQNADFASTGPNQFCIRAWGGVGINTNDPQAPLHVHGDIRWGTANALTLNQSGAIELGDSTQSGTIPFIDFHYGVGTNQDYNTRIINDGEGQLSVYHFPYRRLARFNDDGLAVNGNVQCTVLQITSDRDAKQDFAPVDTTEILDRLAGVPIQTWSYKTDPGTPHIGPVAQDFHAAFGKGADDKHIATVDLDGVALAAIQGLYRIVKDNDAEIAELKRRLAAIEAKFTHADDVPQQQSNGGSAGIAASQGRDRTSCSRPMSLELH